LTRPADERAAWCWDEWQVVLGKPPSSLEANFFVEGGNSLSATEFATRLEARTRVEIPVNLVFEFATFASIVAAVEGLETSAASNEVQPSPAAGVLRRVLPPAGPDVPHVVVMPALTAVDSPLQPLFARVCDRPGWGLSATAVPADGVGAGWVDDVVNGVAEAVAPELRERVVLVVGWSFGAWLALRVVERALATAGDTAVGRLVAVLLDPPSFTPEDIADLRSRTISGLRRQLPHLMVGATNRTSWPQIAALAERALKYRDGPSRIVSALPDELRQAVSAAAARRERDLTVRLRHLFTGLEVAGAAGSPWEPGGHDQAATAPVAHLLACSYRASRTGQGFAVTSKLRLDGATHTGMVLPELADRYLEWLLASLWAHRRGEQRED
jgi:pimeloyl-ACP methyl ester carboxylesterase/acyl carrier protein